MAGNTVVVKAPPTTPLSFVRTVELIAAELPAGVLNVVSGHDAVLGPVLIQDPRVRKVGFTGSVGAGKRIMAMCADNLTRVLLELGGNDPALVLEDAVIDEGTIGKLYLGAFLTTGQVCMAMKRLYVHRSHYDAVVEGLSGAVGAQKIGPGLHADATMGPLNSARQRDYVRGLLDEVRADAEVRELAEPVDEEAFARGQFMRPSLVLDPRPDSRLVTEEQFGPTLPIIPFDDEESAIAAANDTWSGLCSSVWSSDLEHAGRVGARLRTGFTFVNAHNAPFLDERAPFGGFNQSGKPGERAAAERAPGRGRRRRPDVVVVAAGAVDLERRRGSGQRRPAVGAVVELADVGAEARLGEAHHQRSLHPQHVRGPRVGERAIAAEGLPGRARPEDAAAVDAHRRVGRPLHRRRIVAAVPADQPEHAVGLHVDGPGVVADALAEVAAVAGEELGVDRAVDARDDVVEPPEPREEGAASRGCAPSTPTRRRGRRAPGRCPPRCGEQPAGDAREQPVVAPRAGRRAPLERGQADPGLVAGPQRARGIAAREVVGAVERAVRALQLLQAVEDRARAVEVAPQRERGRGQRAVVGPRPPADPVAGAVAGRWLVGRDERHGWHDCAGALERGLAT